MKLLSACLVLVLALPSRMLAATSLPQSEPVAPATAASTSAPTHHPLFHVRHVLVSATPSPVPTNLPEIQLGSPKPVIHPLLPRGGANVTLGDRFRDPTIRLCSGWGCGAPQSGP